MEKADVYISTCYAWDTLTTLKPLCQEIWSSEI